MIVLGLAMNIAPELTGPAIRDSIRKIQDPDGAVIGTGPEEFAKAIALIKEGKPDPVFGRHRPRRSSTRTAT